VNQADIEQIKNRLESAGSPSWEVVGNTVFFGKVDCHVFPGDIATARFIAHAPNDIRTLLKVIEDLQDGRRV